MKRFHFLGITLLSLCGWLLAVPHAMAEQADVYAPLTTAEAREKALDWLHRQSGDEQGQLEAALQQAADAIWQLDETSTVDERFNAVVQTFYLGDESVRELVDACLQSHVWQLPPSFAALDAAGQDLFYANNLRLFYARFLTVGGAYDRAMMVFDQIDPMQVADPAAALFYRAVCEHGLLLKQQGLQTIAQLLEQTEDVPARYRSVAALMQADLAQLEEKSLGEVARQMRDVRRRLSLGHGGPRVQEVEEKIIATLDELIEKLESQQGGASSASSSGQGSPPGSQSQSPMQDSRIAGGSGPGEVDPKDLSNNDNWGGLPDKAETDAKNLINRQFPQHYRQAVEEYLKKLAERPASQR